MCREVVPGVVPRQIKIIQGFRVPRVPGLKSSESAGLFGLTFIRREFYKSEVKDSCPEKKRVNRKVQKSSEKNHVVGPVL